MEKVHIQDAGAGNEIIEPCFKALQVGTLPTDLTVEGGGSPKPEPVPQLKTWRCTISSRYPWGTPGYKDYTARQGYYFVGVTPGDAIEHMTALFPNESVCDFTVEECD